ncbi:MAG: hypothetical protein ABGY41_10425 [Candidatus Poribacteria bacterium]
MHRVMVAALAFGVVCGAAGAADESLADPFDGGSLANENWQWEFEPADWDVGDTTPGWLTMVGEPNRNLWAGYTTSHLYQEHSGDFDIETHMITHYVSSSVVAGIVAYSPTTQDHAGRDGEWVAIKLWGRGGGDNDAVIQYQAREFDAGEGFVGTVPGFLEPHDTDIDLYIRLQREGATFTAWYKRADGDPWLDIGATDQDLEDPLRVGLFNGVADAAGEITTRYEYVVDSLVPFAVEPGGKLPLTWSQLKGAAE